MSENNQAEEREIIATVLGYCENGGTHLQPDVMKIPVIEYTDSISCAAKLIFCFVNFQS